MYQDYNVEVADFFDETSRFKRFLIALFMLNLIWLIAPIRCYKYWLSEEVRISMESLKRKQNKLYLKGILKEN